MSETIDPNQYPDESGNRREFNSGMIERARKLLSESPERIGPYRILEKIADGGMGEVYVAEQSAPIKRRVALKIIKAGMDTRQVVARFEAERQALAMMDHPNIAKVFDAGTTETGRPFFVMELVKGVPITQFCDENKLTTRQRIELLIPVCQAVQHAHQKGIIHRDIKPSNVLVTLHDGKPVPKVIDFGIAKATHQPLTDLTVYTEFRQMIGTPAYMSPEQAEMSGLDIDTRSDIYSLGVLMYEILTSTTPFESARLVKAGMAEIQRIIREEEPQAPSLRISSLGQTLPSVAAQRGIEPARLGKVIVGELDWIVMKALEKDRKRRYDTANDFAADLNRHLFGEPIIAAPPSVLYRAQKFIRKHRGSVVTTSVVFLMTLLGLAGTTWQWRNASQSALSEHTQKVEAERQKDIAENESYIANLALADSAIGVDRWSEARNRLEACRESRRGWEWHFLNLRAKMITYSFPGMDSIDFVITTDGKYLCGMTDTRQVNIWDLKTRRLVRTFDTLTTTGTTTSWFNQALQLSPDSRSILVANFNRAAVYDLEGNQISAIVDHGDYINGIEYSPDGKSFSTSSSRNQRLKTWSFSGQLINDKEVSQKPSKKLFWDKRIDGLVIEPGLNIRDKDGRYLGKIADRWLSARYAQFIPGTNQIVIRSDFSEDVNFEIADIDHADSPWYYFNDQEVEWAMSSPGIAEDQLETNRSYKLVQRTDEQVEVQRYGKLVARLPWLASDGEYSCYTVGADRLVIGVQNSIRFYDIATWRELASFPVDATVKDIQFTPDQTRLIVRLAYGPAEVWDTRGRAERQKDRDDRFNEIPGAKEYTLKLWLTDVPTEKLEDYVVNDSKLPLLKKIVASELVTQEIDRIKSQARERFETITQGSPNARTIEYKISQIEDARLRERANILFEYWKRDYLDLSEKALKIAVESNATTAEYAQALELAKKANEFEETAVSLNALGAALYRAGDYEKAIQALQKADELSVAAGYLPGEYNWGFIAMAYYKLTRYEDAHAALATLHQCAEQGEAGKRLRAEAEAMINPATSRPSK